MVRVKICGITRLEDALAAIEAGADALGFVFAPNSKRLVEAEEVEKITAKLPPFVTTVGVFQNQSPWEVNGIMDTCRLHVAQLHGAETPKYFSLVRYPILKGVCVSGKEDLEKLPSYGQDYFLLDSGTGGTGRTFDWELAVEAKKYGGIILAGGLTPENVAEAVRIVQPWGVDTSGGVESSPGIKDRQKIFEFIKNARGF
ncbi:phosphoribosylanthranilate isomerase [bacterium]|nr:MAG: phosphoribosylanthranilate isomerase [bacterium]